MLVVLAFVMLTTVNAEEASGVDITVSSGYVLPSSPMTFSSYWKMQYGAGIGAGVPLSNAVTLLGTVEYYRFALNTTGVSNSFDTQYMRDIWAFSDVSLRSTADPSSVVSAAVNLQVSPSAVTGIVSPYFTGGIGVMSLTLGEIALPVTSVVSANGSQVSMTALQKITGGTQTSALVQFGVGVNLRMTSLMHVFVEARFVHGVAKGLGTSYVPLTAGIKIRL